MGSVTHVLDACAILAYLRREPGHEQMAAIITDPVNTLAVHAVNLGEVSYVSLRELGAPAAETALRSTCAFAKVRRWLSRPFLAKVADWKVRFRISYADAFALALAEVEGAALVTTDHHEFDPIDQAGAAKLLWIR